MEIKKVFFCILFMNYVVYDKKPKPPVHHLVNRHKNKKSAKAFATKCLADKQGTRNLRSETTRDSSTSLSMTLRKSKQKKCPKGARWCLNFLKDKQGSKNISSRIATQGPNVSLSKPP